MSIMVQRIKGYAGEIWSRKVRLVAAVLVSCILFAASSYYLYDGINKKFCIYTLLCLLTGAFLVLPRVKKWYCSLLLILMYLMVVPTKIFERMELPVHDMSLLLEGAFLVNILIIFLVYAVLLLVSQRIGIALSGGGTVLLIAFLVNYYVRQFRGTCFVLQDILAVGTAVTVVDHYKFTMDGELWYSILYFLSFISCGAWCEFPREITKKKRYHLAVTGIAVSYIVFFFAFWKGTDYLQEHQLQGIHWSPSSNELLEGFLLNFGLNMQEMHMGKPADYSQKTLEKIAQQAEEEYQSPVTTGSAQQPNIILIMNESWSDLQVLGNLEMSESPVPFVDSMSDNAMKGQLYVNVFGGLTANTEFEVLTGDSMAFLAATAVPYQLQVNHDMYSLSRVLEEQGYQTMAMHPNIKTAWNRDKVYSFLGFQQFVDIYEFKTEWQYLRGYVSDECNFGEIIWQYEHKQENQPLFLFDVTIQNHSGYAGGIEMPISIEKIGNVPADQAGDILDAETYLNLMRISDKAFADLISYFENVAEPTIICMFGDHQPKLNDNFYDAIFSDSEMTVEEQEGAKYITSYVIWTNYDMDLPEYGDMSANYLGAAVLECAGAELPPYYKFLVELRKEYPVITYHTIDDMKKEQKITEYQMLQYNHLMDKNDEKKIFSVDSE